MKPKPSSIIWAYAPFIVGGAHIIGCMPIDPNDDGCIPPEPTTIVGGDLIVAGQEPGATTSSLYRFSADGTNSKKIDPGPVGLYALSANRTRIVVDRGNAYAMGQPQRTLVFLDPDGANPASLVFFDPSIYPGDPNPQGTSLRFSISPTGSYIAYGVGEVYDKPALYVARTDGSAAQMVLPEGQNGPWTWSPVEDKLAVAGSGSLFIYDADANTLVEATNPNSNIAGHFVWSPDGERLAFTEGVPDDYVLTSVNKQGQDRRDLLTKLELPTAYSSSWSPNGRYFAMVQYESWEVPGHIQLIDTEGTMHRDLVGTPEINSVGWSPACHFVYQQDDGAIKSTTPDGQTVDLAGPDTLVRKAIGPNGRLVHSRDGTYLKTINADGSNPMTYPVPDRAAFSDDGTVVVVAAEPDASGAVPVYAAASDDAQTTLVLTTTRQNFYIMLLPIEGSSGIIFCTEDDAAGWILPTNSGFRAIYPQPPVAKLSWAYAIESSSF